MLTCSSCGTENPAGHRFCGGCGASLATLCPTCGTPAVPGFKFCGSCGSPLGASTPTPVPATESLARVATERRVCSVLFADLVGFTPLSESRDPEEVRELLSRYFDAARTVIDRYGGVVEKFIGDAVMAVWGTPVATDGDAERAVRAALDLVAAVSALGVELHAPGLAARAGVVTGEVAAALGAEGQGMVAGDAVNTAARVQSAADPGTVLVDGATQRLTEAAIELADAGEHVLKGKSEPARLWRAVRVLSGVGGSQRVDGLEAPLTGRDAELRTIKELFHASAERRTPRLLLVSGPAGVGKSRLGWEFEKYIDGLVETIFWHRGRCLSYGEGIAFWALAEIVRQRFAIAEEDTVEAAAAKLVARLPEFVSDETERAYVGPRLGRLLGVSYPSDGGDGALSREELFAGWRLFFERLADVSPVIVLVEDAQHADPALLDFLDHLVDWARSAPIYVLVFARPELEDRRPGWASGRNRTGLNLDPLDARSMDRLLDALVPGMPPDAVAAIADHAQGNPLFAVETVRSLIDRDAVVPIDGVYRLVGGVGELSVPNSLHALLAARLDALDPELRALVSDAAVLGVSFPPEALVAVSGRDPADVRTGLAELLHRGVLEISADRLSPQRGAYHFSQNLLRQVAYDTLSRRDRKARHLAVAAHLRGTFAQDGEEVSDAVARHYLDAIAAVPDDPDVAELRAKAIAMLVRAAERTVGSGAPGRAADTFAQAAALTEQDGSVAAVLAAAGLHERAGAAANAAADFDAAFEHADRASALYAEGGQPRAAARAQVAAGRALRRAGRYGEGRKLLNAALAVLRIDPDHDTVAGLMELATGEVFAGNPGCYELASEALEMGQALEVGSSRLCDLFITRGLAAEGLNRHEETAADLRHAARLARRAGYTTGLSRALLNLSSVTLAHDPVDAAITAREAADCARQLGDRYFLPAAVANQSAALLLTGKWDEAASVLRQAVDVDGLSGDTLTSGFVGMYTTTVAALRGDLPAAEAAAARLTPLRDSDDPQDRASADVADACVAALRKAPGDTLRHARDAMAKTPLGISHETMLWCWSLAARTAHDVGDTATVLELIDLLDRHPIGHVPPLLRAERTLARARLLAAEGDPEAGSAFSAAIGELRTVGSPYHLAQALLDQAAASEPSVAAVLVDEARDIAAKLGAQPLLDRANAAQVSSITS